MACKYQVKECKCSGIKLEKQSQGPVDVLFITEFPGKTETKEKKFLIGAHGKFFREILKVLKEQTGFTYAITGVTRSTSNPGVLVHSSPEVKACLNCLELDIEKCEPKIIVFLGDLPYTVFSKNHSLPKHGSRVEDGRLLAMNFFGKKYPVMFCQHPTWYLHNEACAVGFLYENIRIAIDYCKNRINPNVPNDFKTETLSSLKDVKEVLTDLSQVKDFITVDTEGTGLSRVYGNTLLSVQLSADGKTGYVIPYLHKDSPFLDRIPKLKNLLVDFFFDKDSEVYGYVFVNAKYDYHQFFREMHRFTFNAPVIDTSFGEFSLEENLTRVHSYPKGKGPYSLFTMAYKRGFRFYSKTDSKEKREILDKIPLEEWQDYAAADVVSPWYIFKKQIQKASRTNYREGFLFLNCIYENHLIRCLTYAEHCGLSVNANKVRAFLSSDSIIKSGLTDITNRFYSLPSVQEANARLSKGKTGIATGLAGSIRTWVPSSPKHRELLYFDILGLDPVNEEDDGDNSHTGKNFQKNYTGITEVDLLAEYMSFDKMMSGFIKPMAGYLDPTSPNGNIDMFTDSRARTTFYPMAVTGRIRSANPNTQQRPAGRSTAAKEILSMYEPKKGRVVVKLDYATFEVKGSGFLSGDKEMIKSFQYMHQLKETFRENPRAFVEDGYKLQKDLLDEVKEGLRKKKKELLDTKGVISKEKFKEAKELYLKDLEEYKKSIQDLEDMREKEPVKLSKSYVSMLTDSHRKFASLFFKTPVTKITKAQRQHAKTLVFGCFTGDTIVSTETGGKRLSLIDTSPRVVSLGGQLRESMGVVSKGIQKVYEVRTDSNYLEGTSGHEILCVTKNVTLEKVALGKLRRGDAIVKQQGVFGNSIPVFDGRQISVEDAEAMGLLTADGSFGSYNYSNYRVHHGSASMSEVQIVQKFISKYTGICPCISYTIAEAGAYVCGTILKRRTGVKLYYLQINNKALFNAIKMFGLAGRQVNRRVPNQILSAKPEYVAAYLRGFFDGDGGIRKSSRKYMQIFASSCNRRLLSDIAYLLSLFGIESHIYGRGSFELVITSSISIRKYEECIGFSTKHKKTRLSQYVKFLAKTRASSPKNVYPFRYSQLRSIYAKKAGVSHFRKRTIYYKGIEIPSLPKGIKGLLSSIDFYKGAFFALGLKKQWECLKLLSSTGCSVSIVTFAPHYKGRKEVFDVMEVEGQHLWCANNSVVSNSLYGMSIQSISKALKITEEEGNQLHDKYMKSFPYAAKWLAQSKKFAKKHFYVQSPLGRRRRLWGYLRLDKGIAGKMDRYAGNTIIQGFCSDCNIIAGSLLASVIEAHGKLKYQVPDKDSWELTNIIHDSCEFEVPLEDTYYFIKEMEKIFTDYLTLYIKKVFGFSVDIPLEVDFTIGTNYGNTRDWDGSEEDLINAIKWLCEETAKRDKTDVMNYKKLVKSPLYKEFPKGFVLNVIKDVIRKDLKTVNKLELHKGMGGKA